MCTLQLQSFYKAMNMFGLCSSIYHRRLKFHVGVIHSYGANAVPPAAEYTYKYVWSLWGSILDWVEKFTNVHIYRCVHVHILYMYLIQTYFV